MVLNDKSLKKRAEVERKVATGSCLLCLLPYIWRDDLVERGELESAWIAVLAEEEEEEVEIRGDAYSKAAVRGINDSVG